MLQFQTVEQQKAIQQKITTKKKVFDFFDYPCTIATATKIETTRNKKKTEKKDEFHIHICQLTKISIFLTGNIDIYLIFDNKLRKYTNNG